MNPRDYFEITHSRVFECTTIPELLQANLRTYNNCTVTLSSLQAKRRHPLYQLRQVSEPVYYLLNGNVYQLAKKESHFYQGEKVLLLGVIRYRGMYEIEFANVQAVVDLRRRNKQQFKQSNRQENIRENDEIFVINEVNLDEYDEYVFSYFLQYRHKQISLQQQVPEEIRVDKRGVFDIKVQIPFESVYSIVTDSFPVIYIEYQCSNVSGQRLDFKEMTFKLESFMALEKHRIGNEPIVLFSDESVRMVFKITVKLDDMAALARYRQNIFNLEDNTFDYDLRVGGGIYLEWGVCGKYQGQPKTTIANIQPMIVRLENDHQAKLEKDKITKLSIDIQLGIFFPPSGAEILVRLEETEMKSVKIIGIDRMVFCFICDVQKIVYDQFVRVNTLVISVVSTTAGIGQIKGLNFVDSISLKPISYQNLLFVVTMNPSGPEHQTPQLTQKVQIEDLLIDQFEQVEPLSKQQSSKQQQEINLLDLDIQEVQNVELI